MKSRPSGPRALLALSASLLALAGSSAAQNLTTVRVASGLLRPLFAGAPANDFRHLYVLEQFSGRIRLIDLTTNTVLPTPFLDIDNRVINSGNERGLLGLAFHPNYATNGYLYVHYNDNSGNTVISRFSRGASPLVADPNSELVLFTTTQPFSNHNGGWIGFSPNDGYLYIALGDGGSGNDPGNRAQTGSTPLGKMLRIDVDNPTPPRNYGIPASNPFVGTTSFLPEIWAYGLRNPWRCSFDRQNGALYIGDVGQNAIEEIDYQPGTSPGGENYGWRCMEGNNCTGLSGCTCNSPTLTRPVQTYSHSFGCSVTGGYVYRGCAIPSLRGTYFYADYCSARIWSFQIVNGQATNVLERTAQLAPGGGLAINSITSFGEDALGEIYIVDQGGEVFKIIEANSTEPDCNGNRIADRCEILAGLAKDVDNNGIIDTCEGLRGDVTEISAASGGTQNLTLVPGFAFGLRDYILAGSVSGATPGIPLGPAHIPLNFDPYFEFTLANPNTPPLSMSFGQITFLGIANAAFTVPPGFPELIGLTFYHSYAILPDLAFVSGPSCVTITP